MKAQVINIFAGPGAGKSTTAAAVFAEMKKRHLDVELVTEYAKELLAEERMNVLLEDQLYITAKQARRIKRVENKFQYIVTDAPIVQGLLYKPHDYFTGFEPLIVEIFKTYNNHNFFLACRTKYDKNGRYQSEQEAIEIDSKLMDILTRHDISFDVIDDLNQAGEIIINKLTNS